MDKKTIAKLQQAYCRYHEILAKDGFTDEAEKIGDSIAWYCVVNNISNEQFNKEVLNR